MSGLKKERLLVIIAIIVSICIVSACSNKNIVTKKSSEDEESTESLGETYGFTSFSVKIDTKDKKEALVANYDEKRDKTEAVYENKLDDAYLHGDKAMDKLDTIFKDLAIEPDLDDEDMIKNTSEAFEIADYKSLKLTIKFKGHDTKELMMMK